MNVLVLNRLIVEVVERIIQELYDRGGRIFNVERDLRIADLHDIGLLAAHLKRFGKKLNGAGDIALGYVANDLAADLHVLLAQFADLDLRGANGRRFDLDAARRNIGRQQDRIGNGLLARVSDRGKIAHEMQLARVEVKSNVARHLELQINGCLFLPADAHQPLVGKRRILVEKFDRYIMDINGDGFPIVDIKPDCRRNENGQGDIENLTTFTFHRHCPPFRCRGASKAVRGIYCPAAPVPAGSAH